MEKYYLRNDTDKEIPFDHIVPMQHYIMPNYGTFNWDTLTHKEVEANLARLRNNEDAFYDRIQMYIHIPYCNYFCNYCTFTRSHYPRKNDDQLDRYINYLIKEIDYYLQKEYVQSRQFTSICIGGGSPSILPLKVLEKLFLHLMKVVPNYETIEKTFTGEASTLRNLDILKLLNDYSWNRITWGIETLDEKIRKQIGRHDSIDDIEAVFNGLKKINFKGENCVDIMFDLPGQTLEGFQHELSMLVERFNPDMIDAYSTIYLPYRLMWKLIEDGKADQPGNIWQLLQMREHIYDYLLEKGYNNIISETYSKKRTKPTQYLKGMCAHEDIIPVGVAARGNFKDMVTINPDNLTDWLNNIDNYNVSTQTIQSIGRDGVFNRIMVMWPRYKILHKDLLKKFSDIKNYKKLMLELKKHIRIGVADEYTDCYKINKLGVIWHGNLQTDYMKHSFNFKGKFLKHLISIKTKNFNRNERFTPNVITKAIWKRRNMFPDFK